MFCLTELLYGLANTEYSSAPSSSPTSSPMFVNNSCHLLNLKHFALENGNQFRFEYDTKGLNNLHQILLNSPRSIDNNNEKILFIFYQLLKLYKHFHSLNINCSELKLSDIYIDKNFWIKIKPPFESILNQYVVQQKKTQPQQSDSPANQVCKLKFIYNLFKFLFKFFF